MSFAERPSITRAFSGQWCVVIKELGQSIRGVGPGGGQESP